MKKFEGLENQEAQRGGKYFSGDPKWRRGCQEAGKAQKFSASKRLESLVVCTAGSDEDEDHMEDDGVFNFLCTYYFFSEN